MGTCGLHNVRGVGCGSIRWEGEKKPDSTSGRVGLRAWDVSAENGGEWARERRWGVREALGSKRGVGA